MRLTVPLDKSESELHLGVRTASIDLNNGPHGLDSLGCPCPLVDKPASAVLHVVTVIDALDDLQQVWLLPRLSLILKKNV